MAVVKHRTTGKVLLRVKNPSFAGKILRGFDLAGADFSGQDLTKCVFRNCNLTEADFRKADLRGAEMDNSVARRSDFSKADISKADFSDGVFDQARFIRCVAVETKFRHSKINQAQMTGGNFQKCDFFFAELRSDFQGADLRETNLFGADLTEADFTQADLRRANMTDATIIKAVFSYSKMKDSIGTKGQLWGYTPKAEKKPWWQIWKSAAM